MEEFAVIAFLSSILDVIEPIVKRLLYNQILLTDGSSGRSFHFHILVTYLRRMCLCVFRKS